MKFAYWCQYMATDEHVIIDETDVTCPYHLQRQMQSLVDIMLPKMDILDRIHVPFIEKALSQSPNVMRERLEHTCHGNIPEGLMNALSIALFHGETFNSLSSSNQAIIKVLAVYLMIQN